MPQTMSSYRENYPISQNVPYQMGDSWYVYTPGTIRLDNVVGVRFWSDFHEGIFELTEEIGEEFILHWISDIEIEDLPEEPVIQHPVHFDFTENEPFLFNDRWHVVMAHSSYSYLNGARFWSEMHTSDFELTIHLEDNYFGAENTWRINWVVDDEYPEEEYPEEDDYGENNVDGYSEEREEVEIRDVAPLMTTNIGRDIPLVSFEQEFSGNGDKVARELYDAGFAANSFVEDYHSSDTRFASSSEKICYVETDSSCGYEVIFSKLNLKNRRQAENVSSAQTILRNLKDEGSIRLSARCGFHVHLDVSDWGMKEIVSAYHLWNYLEDTVFRFASAFWGSHRDEETGNNYSPSIPKGYNSRRDIGRNLTGRRDALNFSHLLAARGRCNCEAAFYEDWANCTCDLAQQTLEFRVFNATTNQRKIRAYLAFCVAFVNIAKIHDHTPSEFPEMRFTRTDIRNVSMGDNSWEDSSQKRIRYILQEFPLTSTEKTDIMYCLRNCSLETVLETL